METSKQAMEASRREKSDEIRKMLDNASLEQICIITLLVRGMLGQTPVENAANFQLVRQECAPRN